MKKTNLFAGLVLSFVFTSCYKSAGSDASPPPTKTYTLNVAYVAVVKEVPFFPGGRDIQTQPGKNLKNLQTNDIVKYKFTISGALNADSLTTYEIVPIGYDETKHQILNKDFSLNTVSTGNRLAQTNKISVANKQQAECELYIKMLKPGNFQLQFALNEIKSGKNTQIATATILSNVVRIVAYRYECSYTMRVPALSHKVYIDAGNQKDDPAYLTHGISQCEIIALNSRNSADSRVVPITDFKPNTTYDFYDMQTGSTPSFVSNKIQKISFKKEINGMAYMIEYEDIPVVDAGWQDAWKYKGNPNP